MLGRHNGTDNQLAECLPRSLFIGWDLGDACVCVYLNPTQSRGVSST